jgi:outer membrane protein OmpA-like peptidoglycan-associated protein
MNLLPRRWITALLLLAAAATAAPEAPGAQELLRFRYSEEDKYRILSTTDQVVTINGEVHQENQITNRIAIEVTDADGDSGLHEMTAAVLYRAQFAADILQYGREYESEFRRDARGYYEIDPSFEVPPTQNVPIFPEAPVSVGDSWSFEGREIINLQESLDVSANYRGPILARISFPVGYRFEAVEERDGEPVAVIDVDYALHHRPSGVSPDLWYPVLISGEIRQRIYWNLERGRLVESDGTYVFAFSMATGDIVVFQGTSRSEVIDSRPLDRENVRRRIEDDLKERGVEDAEVTSDDRGVTITLDNVQFPPDSAFLVPAEQGKLRQIGEILRNYPENDILVSGHTALAGTAEGRQRLSEQRAAAVGEFLIDEGVREPDRILYRGFGAREPVADNSTPEGMRKNRRVEITILEN